MTCLFANGGCYSGTSQRNTLSPQPVHTTNPDAARTTMGLANLSLNRRHHTPILTSSKATPNPPPERPQATPNPSPKTSATVIDAGAFPHIIEFIIKTAPFDALVALRGTCRHVRDLVDKWRMPYHVASTSDGVPLVKIDGEWVRGGPFLPSLVRALDHYPFRNIRHYPPTHRARSGPLQSVLGKGDIYLGRNNFPNLAIVRQHNPRTCEYYCDDVQTRVVFMSLKKGSFDACNPRAIVMGRHRKLVVHLGDAFKFKPLDRSAFYDNLEYHPTNGVTVLTGSPPLLISLDKTVNAVGIIAACQLLRGSRVMIVGTEGWIHLWPRYRPDVAIPELVAKRLHEKLISLIQNSVIMGIREFTWDTQGLETWNSMIRPVAWQRPDGLSRDRLVLERLRFVTLDEYRELAGDELFEIEMVKGYGAADEQKKQ